jgi:hypothetical protein
VSERRSCETCGGRGYVVVGAGLVPLEERYPDLPIHEMYERGWLAGAGDGEDVQVCDEAFLRFWRVDSHEAVVAYMASPDFPERSLTGSSEKKGEETK